MSDEEYLGREMLEIYGPQQCELIGNYPKIELGKPYELPIGHQKLTAQKLFDQECPPIGTQNIKNIDGILNDYERLMFFGQLLSIEHRRRYQNSVNDPYWRYPGIRNGRTYHFNYQNDVLTWNIDGQSSKSGSIFEMIANLYGIDLFYQQVGILTGLLGFNFLSLSTVKTLERNCLINTQEQYLDEILAEINMFDVTRQHNNAIMRNRTDIIGSQGELLSSILLYQWQNHFFCIPASIEKPEYLQISSPKLAIGKHIAPAVFINQNLFSKYPNANIIFCQDIRLAIKLDSLLKNDSTYNPAEFFITSSFGLEFEKYTWEYFHCRNILFIPAPTRESLSIVTIYKKYSVLSGYGSFKILDHFILPFLKDSSVESELSDAEKFILSNSTSIEDISEINSFLNEIKRQTLTLEEFTKKYKSLGIFRKKANESEENIDQDTHTYLNTLPVPDPAWELPMPKTFQEVKINHFLKPGSLIMLIGTKNAGKTQVSYLLSKSALPLDVNLPLFSANSGRPFANIFLIDGESEDITLTENLNQHRLSPELNRRLYILSRFQKLLPQWANNFTLTDSCFRAGISHYIYQNHCQLLILDNLSDLMGDSINYQSKTNEIITWIRELQQSGVCVLLLHHKANTNSKSNPDKTSGSQIFRRLSRTNINLYGVKEILSDNTVPQEVRRVAQNAGLTIGLEFTSCKAAPILETATIWAHLPLGSSDWKYICATNKAGEEIEWPISYNFDASPILSGVHMNETNSDKKLMDVHPKAPQIYQVLLSKHGYVKLGEIASEFSYEKGMGEDTIRKILKGLRTLGYVDITGERQSTMYKAIQKS